jgi:DNA-binding response OmpR family regulator
MAFPIASTLTILHVEDDPSLAELVEDAFVAFGFTGAYLHAMTVAQAEQILADPTAYPRLDLILSDMNLPDGSGLDVVSSVRANAFRRRVPIVILSGDTNPATVNGAYAVGANSFVSKGTRGRSIGEMMSTLYEHWLRDASLPKPERTTRTQQVVARAIAVGTRNVELYMRIGEQLGVDEGVFWMDLALREGNAVSLLRFLLEQLGGRELSPDVLSEGETVMGARWRALDELARSPVKTAEQAEAAIREMVQQFNIGGFLRANAELFPVVPVALTTLREVAAGTLDDIAAWIETHAKDPDLRGQVVRLRAAAEHIRVPSNT